MKYSIVYITALLLALLSCRPSPQPGGSAADNASAGKLYKSTPQSHRQNFYLQTLDDTTYTLYGWEVNMENDTIYYKSSAKNEAVEKNGIHLNFEQFDFSPEPIAGDYVDGFKTDFKLEMPAAFLHRHFSGTTSMDSIIMDVTKDVYDSASDEFEFVQIKN